MILRVAFFLLVAFVSFVEIFCCGDIPRLLTRIKRSFPRSVLSPILQNTYAVFCTVLFELLVPTFFVTPPLSRFPPPFLFKEEPNPDFPSRGSSLYHSPFCSYHPRWSLLPLDPPCKDCNEEGCFDSGRGSGPPGDLISVP